MPQPRAKLVVLLFLIDHAVNVTPEAIFASTTALISPRRLRPPRHGRTLQATPAPTAVPRTPTAAPTRPPTPRPTPTPQGDPTAAPTRTPTLRPTEGAPPTYDDDPGNDKERGYGGRSRGPATSFVLVIVLLVIIVVVIRFLMFGLMVFGGCGGPPGCCCCFCL